MAVKRIQPSDPSFKASDDPPNIYNNLPHDSEASQWLSRGSRRVIHALGNWLSWGNQCSIKRRMCKVYSQDLSIGFN